MFFSVLAYGARTDQKSRAEYSGQSVSKGGQPWRKSARPDNASKDERLMVHNCKHTRPNPSGPNNDQECTKPSGRLKPRISVRSSGNNILDAPDGALSQLDVPWTAPRFSASQVDKAGKRLLDSVGEEYDRAASIVINWRGAHGFPLSVIEKRLRKSALAADSHAVI